jgi:photosystem II stability/assembly factor-like uncharacterized protein
MLRLILAMEDAVLTMDRDSNRTNVYVSLVDRAPQSLASNPHDSAQVFCGTFGHGLWRSDDAGDSWAPLAAFGGKQVTAVTVSPQVGSDPGVVYAGTEPSAIFRSPDGGATWQECHGLAALPSASTWSFPPRPETHHVRWMAADAAVPGRVFAAIEAGALVRSLDGGSSWHDRVPDGPYDTHTLTTTARAPDRVYVAAGDGYFESDDGGVSWRQPQDGLAHRYLWSVAVDRGDAERMVASAARGPQPAHSARTAESYLYVRQNEGRWAVVHDGLPSPRGTTVSTVITDPMRSGAFYAANNRGVYWSADGEGGASWTSTGPSDFNASGRRR